MKNGEKKNVLRFIFYLSITGGLSEKVPYKDNNKNQKLKAMISSANAWLHEGQEKEDRHFWITASKNSMNFRKYQIKTDCCLRAVTSKQKLTFLMKADGRLYIEGNWETADKVEVMK